MRRERGQALVEAVAALPVCVACALAIVDCGIEVRDRIAVTQAATRAAEAHLVGDDAGDAARAAVPSVLEDSVRVDVQDERVVVSATGSSRLASMVGRPIVHRSSVEVAR